MRFILVDSIIELVPGKNIIAAKTLTAGEEIFLDHFPSFPVVPGVLLTEMMAQAAGKCLDAERKPRGKAMLARIKSAGFHHWVLPDQKLTIFAEIKNNQDSYATAECRIEAENKRVCKSELFFGFLSYDHLAPDFRDEILENFLAAKLAAK
ncbi:MAG: 3-hydroxyacyl-ACP dehydratase FabZ family protein [Desulfatirhabdiaceae bacterium]